MAGDGSAEVYLRLVITECRKRGGDPVLFGIGGSWLMEMLKAEGITCVPWRDIDARDGIASLSKALPGACEAKRISLSWGAVKQSILRRVPVSVKLVLGNLRQIICLYKAFGRVPIDVMHINVHGYEVAGVSCRWRGIPCLGLYHISPVREHDRVRRWLIRKTAHSYNLLVGVSLASAKAWGEWCDMPSGRCVAVYNGLNLEKHLSFLHPAKVPDDPFNLLCVAKLHPMKGLKYLISAMRLLRDRPVTLSIAGGGELEETLKGQAEEMGVSDRIRFWGHLSDPAPLYEAADCFVLPSVALEGCPFVLIEAMASVLPAITSDFGPLAEVNLDGVTGLVVPMADPDRLAQAIRNLMDSAETCRRMGEAGRARALSVFSFATMVDNLMGLYLKLGQARRPGCAGTC